MDLGALITSWKQPLLDLAEVCDAWRFFPRAFLSAYGYLCLNLSTWYMALKVPTGEQTMFVTTVIGLAVPLTGWYMSSARRTQ